MFAELKIRMQRHEFLPGSTMPLRVDYRQRHNARRYILRVNERGDGGYVTIPRGGSWKEARLFAVRNAAWLEERLRHWQEKRKATQPDDRILFRGEFLRPEEVLARCGPPQSALNAEIALRPAVLSLLRQIATMELPTRTFELASAHGLEVRRVSVRNQRSRWGSCSANRVISLNWRLVQAPEFVRDYIIVHELMHLREMNHSARYWKLVNDAFPRTPEAERWLKEHGGLLRG